MHPRGKALLAFAQIELPAPLPRPADFIEAIAAGAVVASVSGPYVLLSYTRAAAEPRWRKVAAHARGLIVDTNSPDDPVAARPFRQFLDLERGDPLPRATSPQEVTRKLDGAIAISYRAGGRVRWAGRTSFRSLPARIAAAEWERRTERALPDDLTLLCEVRDPSLRTVLPAAARTLHVTGATDRRTWRDIGYDELSEIARLARLPVVERVAWPGDLERLWAVLLGCDLRTEGFVLRWSDGLRARVVHPDYGPIYDLISEPTPWMVSEIWGDHDDPRRLLERLPAAVVARVIPLLGELDELLVEVRRAGLGEKSETVRIFRARHADGRPRRRFFPLDV